MQIGDLVCFGSDRTVGIILDIRKNGDCCCLFNGYEEIFLCDPSSLEVISESR